MREFEGEKAANNYGETGTFIRPIVQPVLLLRPYEDRKIWHGRESNVWVMAPQFVAPQVLKLDHLLSIIRGNHQLSNLNILLQHK